MASQTISWVDSNGGEFLLDDPYTVLAGLNGFYMPPIAYKDEEVPFQHGSRLRNIKVQARELDVPLKISGATSAELDQNLRTLLRIFNPLNGDGKLKVISTDGVQREINCRYINGFEMQEGVSNRSERWQRAVGVFRAFDPFWYDVATQVQTFNSGQPATFFPFFPLRLSSSTVFADTSIDNTGDVEAYPEWVVHGPGENVVLRNYTTGEITQLNVSLGVGEYLTIDTRPFVKTVTKSDGTNLFYTLTDDSSLWSLQPGVNSIRLEMSNATDESSIQLSYKNRYWGP